MTRAEISRLLALAAGYDQRTTSDDDVKSWFDALGALDAEDAMTAIIEHYQRSTARIMPADVWNRCRPAASRLPSAAPLPERSAGADPSRWRSMWRDALDSAAVTCEARRASVLRHPDLAARLTGEPIGYQSADQWNGWIPPPVISPGGGPELLRSPSGFPGHARAGGETMNDSPRRAALVEVAAEAWRRDHEDQA